MWRQNWAQHRYRPVVTRSEDGSRFGLSTLRFASSSVPAADNLNVNDPNTGLEQVVEVYETASGSPIQSLQISPVVLSGQNVALSPDGRRLAVLHDSTLEVYGLPQMSTEEQAKFTALKAGWSRLICDFHQVRY